MVDERMHDGVYSKTEDNTLQELKRFQDFSYRNFRKLSNNTLVCYQVKPNCTVIQNS